MTQENDDKRHLSIVRSTSTEYKPTAPPPEVSGAKSTESAGSTAGFKYPVKKASEKPRKDDNKNMTDYYNRTETDLKLENLEQRLDNKLDKVLHEVKEGFLKVENSFNGLDNKFTVIETKLTHMDRLVWGVFIGIVIIILGAAVKYLWEPIKTAQPQQQPAIYYIRPQANPQAQPNTPATSSAKQNNPHH